MESLEKIKNTLF